MNNERLNLMSIEWDYDLLANFDMDMLKDVAGLMTSWILFFRLIWIWVTVEGKKTQKKKRLKR